MAEATEVGGNAAQGAMHNPLHRSLLEVDISLACITGPAQSMPVRQVITLQYNLDTYDEKIIGLCRFFATHMISLHGLRCQHEPHHLNPSPFRYFILEQGRMQPDGW